MVELVDGLPSKLETLQNKISKTDTLSHDCINLVVCIVDLSHVSIDERVYYSYCSRDIIFVRLYTCSDCDLNINKIWKQFQLKTNRIDKRVKVLSYEKNTNERLPHQSLLLFLYFLYSFTYLISFIINQHLESLIYQSIQQYSYILFLSINYNSLI